MLPVKIISAGNERAEQCIHWHLKLRVGFYVLVIDPEKAIFIALTGISSSPVTVVYALSPIWNLRLLVTWSCYACALYMSKQRSYNILLGKNNTKINCSLIFLEIDSALVVFYKIESFLELIFEPLPFFFKRFKIKFKWLWFCELMCKDNMIHILLVRTFLV